MFCPLASAESLLEQCTSFCRFQPDGLPPTFFDFEQRGEIYPTVQLFQLMLDADGQNFHLDSCGQGLISSEHCCRKLHSKLCSKIYSKL